MSDNRNFWSTVPGLVTGLAGLLTGIVGLLTVSVQLGWVGGGDGSNANSSTSTSTTSTTVDGTTTTLFGSGSSGSSGSTVRSSGSRFELSPSALAFAALGRSEKPLTVRNAGSAPFSVESVTVEGTGSAQFTVDDTGCRVADLAPRDSCDVLVTYTSGGASGPAAVEVTVSGADQPQSAELRVGLL